MSYGKKKTINPSSKIFAQPTKQPAISFKLLLIGDEGVGKTSLTKRFASDTFTPGIDSTMGIDFDSKSIRVDRKTVDISIWDTSGKDVFMSTTMAF